MKALLAGELGYEGPILFPEHHESHAASAFFPSPFPEAAFLTGTAAPLATGLLAAASMLAAPWSSVWSRESCRTSRWTTQ